MFYKSKFLKYFKKSITYLIIFGINLAVLYALPIRLFIKNYSSLKINLYSELFLLATIILSLYFVFYIIESKYSNRTKITLYKYYPVNEKYESKKLLLHLSIITTLLILFNKFSPLLNYFLIFITSIFLSYLIIRTLNFQRFVFIIWNLVLGVFTILLLKSILLGSEIWILYMFIFVINILLQIKCKQFNVISVLILYGFSLHSIGIMHFHYTVVGDEYAFLRSAYEISNNYKISEILNNLFAGTFVYESHPFFSSFIQSLFLKLFGYSNYSWRISSISMVIFASIFFYKSFKEFKSKKFAQIFAFLLITSHYLISFSKIGYNNTQAIFTLSLTIFSLSLLNKKTSYRNLVFVGFASALNFYVYPVALYSSIIPILYLLIFDYGKLKIIAMKFLYIYSSMLLFISPLLNQPKYWLSKIPGTFLFNPDTHSNTTTTIIHFLDNFMQSALSFIYILDDSHFVSISYTDIFVGFFVILGISYALYRRSKFNLLTITIFLFFLFFIGATHDRPYPSVTRMHMVLVVFLIFATEGILGFYDIFVNKFSKLRLNIYLGTVLIIVFISNMFFSFYLDKLFSNRYLSYQSTFVKVAQLKDPSTKLVIINNDELLYKNTFLELIDLYNLRNVYPKIYDSSESFLKDTSIDELDNLIIIDLNKDSLTKEHLGLEDYELCILEKIPNIPIYKAFIRSNSDKCDDFNQPIDNII